MVSLSGKRFASRKAQLMCASRFPSAGQPLNYYWSAMPAGLLVSSDVLRDVFPLAEICVDSCLNGLLNCLGL